jgi:hypothetical protein
LSFSPSISNTLTPLNPNQVLSITFLGLRVGNKKNLVQNGTLVLPWDMVRPPTSVVFGQESIHFRSISAQTVVCTSCSKLR